jgi:hypothetical protein
MLPDVGKLYMSDEIDDQTEAELTEVVEPEAEANEVETEAENEATEANEAEEQDHETEQEQETPEWLSEAQDLANLAAGKAKKKERAKQERLQAKLQDEHNAEVERLRAELEAVRNTPASSSNEPQRPMPPSEADYDSDADYKAAQAKYEDDLYDYRRGIDQKRIEQEQAEKLQAEAQQKAASKRKERIDSHYNRAAEFVDKTQGLTEDAYRTADMMFRQSLGNDGVADSLIERMGEGSEKVVLSIGINAEKREKLKTLLAEDPTGIEAAIFLGEQRGKVNSSGKVSKAGKPAPVVKGNGGKVGNLQAKYKEALKKGDAQGAYNVKRQARQEKINTRDW